MKALDSLRLTSHVKKPAAHYDDAYFQWQNSGGVDAAVVQREIFLPFIDRPDCVLLDFGCGGGFLLNSLPGAIRIGVEINPAAKLHAESLGIKVFSSLSEISTASVDVVISNHALEHVEAPLDVLRDVYRVLKEGGLAVFVVPTDRASFPFKKTDQDFHLYSWSAANLGNLMLAAGLDVVRAEEIVHRWPPAWQTIRRIGGRRMFDVVCCVYGYLRRSRSQVRVVGQKINSSN